MFSLYSSPFLVPSQSPHVRDRYSKAANCSFCLEGRNLFLPQGLLEEEKKSQQLG
jgi:hypothetical protein